MVDLKNKLSGQLLGFMKNPSSALVAAKKNAAKTKTDSPRIRYVDPITRYGPSR